MPENAMQCWGYAYAGEYSCFHHVHPLKQADSEEMKNFFGAVLQQCWFISHNRGFRRFFNPSTGCLEQFCNRKSIDNKMVTGYTEFAFKENADYKSSIFYHSQPCLVFETGQKSNSRAESKSNMTTTIPLLKTPKGAIF